MTLTEGPLVWDSGVKSKSSGGNPSPGRYVRGAPSTAHRWTCPPSDVRRAPLLRSFTHSWIASTRWRLRISRPFPSVSIVLAIPRCCSMLGAVHSFSHRKPATPTAIKSCPTFNSEVEPVRRGNNVPPSTASSIRFRLSWEKRIAEWLGAISAAVTFPTL